MKCFNNPVVLFLIVITIGMCVFGVVHKVNAQEQDCIHTIDSLKCLEYVNNYDGDTVTFNIPKLHPLIGDHIRVRLYGVDTPEVSSRDVCEQKKALQAKRFVENKLSGAFSIRIDSVKRGKYFRIIGDVIIDGNTSLSKMLIDENLGVHYYGGRKPSVYWCTSSMLPKEEIIHTRKILYDIDG